MLYFVRHAKAGSRVDWDGDDRLRPLSKKGWAQADAIAHRLRKRDVAELVSSPYVRCLQTLEPLARLKSTIVQTDERLAEDNDFVGAVQLLESLPDGSVLCSHGDIIPATMQALQRRGCHFHGAADWRKASVWLLERRPDGTVGSARVWAPPGK
jgi:8-oxo-dGTP diphosphatase